LYCRRNGTEAQNADWSEAERETVLSPLAGVEDNDQNIRITAAVPDIDAGHLTVDVLGNSIVVEGVSRNDPRITRYSVFPVNSAIDACSVKAEMNNGYLTIVAPKADTLRG
jgi:HSP20 family molecular chaperone IbpA